ncbi:hypothetical protein [Leptolinea tardivitalis]|uniref:3-keto-disaccharide hydrolase domain-containing protein n=1 Tax=Leptolinea tardivitalis TaxID=229920 RepID=A0A0P6XE89_9CHLR|nr:hypothetical protein [Leptolinea tardivitalis]KPL73487.1 hypothetical protein ADM99_04720 [Leptolinea tardivitalis]GAP21663.1 hypothetical protein LTAR_01876 [Leptolinea tardivitalis]
MKINDRSNKYLKIETLLGFFLGTLLFSACTGTFEQPAYLTPTPTDSPTPTETIIWFPATSTATQVPTRQPEPTENLHPSVTEILFRDDFSNTALWSTKAEAGGNIAYGKNELTLASQEPKTYIASLFAPAELDDASVEISSNVTLCKSEDSYGFLMRAVNGMNGYRFLVNCQGQVKLEVLKSGRPYTLVDWMQSGQVLPGSPYQLRLRVWMVKDELRFFLNDVFQFSARDAVFKKGKVGVFARQAADTPVTVTFTNLIIRAIDPEFVLPKATLKPTATRQPKYIPVNTSVPSPNP